MSAGTTIRSNLPQLNASLERLVNGLIAKEFTFVTPEASPQQLQERLSEFDKGRIGLFGKVFGYAIGASEVPAVVQTITQHVVSLGAEKVADEELAALQEFMRSSFPLCAVAFSRMFGPRFLAIRDGDCLSQPELFEAMDSFEHINLCMMQLGGRLELKLFGKALLGVNSSAATGSLILVASTTERANLLRQWVNSKPLHSDTILNQMKERFTRWQFWTKAIFGMIEYQPHQLRQEVIVLDAQTGQATSTASPRIGFEFGFALTDIASA